MKKTPTRGSLPGLLLICTTIAATAQTPKTYDSAPHSLDGPQASISPKARR